MRRRVLLASTVAAAMSPAIVEAQSPRTVRKIGILHVARFGPTLGSLRPVWQRLGYIEGETVLLRSAEDDLTRLPALATGLIGLGVGVLIAVGGPTVKAASQVTKTVPIVAIDLETDPIRAGYAASFARPGGNVTGLFLDTASIAGKWIELLREAVPSLERIALIWDPDAGSDQLGIARAAAHSMGIESVVIEVQPPDGYEEAARRLASQKRTGIVELTHPGGAGAFTHWAAAAQKYGLPTISFWKSGANAGALLSYGPVFELYFPRAVVLADIILKGANASELPIEQPTKFEVVVNLKTAKALGLTIPPSILTRADEVIE